jgi:formylglycine-generating enzyme required for sulfatase activity
MIRQLTLLSCLLLSSAAFAERQALLIGNAQYRVGGLNNPLNDVTKMTQKLTDLGFRVTPRKNLSKAQMREAIRQFSLGLKAGDEALFYYSGHGMQVNNLNYLIPLKTDIKAEYEIPDEAVPLRFVLQALGHSKSRLNLVILDACRNNPFKSRFKGSNRGLARLNQNVSQSTLVAFSASPTQVSDDGNRGNGLYTYYLLKHLATPNITINQMFNKVRNDVYNESGHKQLPKEESGLLQDVILNPTVVTPVIPSQQQQQREQALRQQQALARQRALSQQKQAAARKQQAAQKIIQPRPRVKASYEPPMQWIKGGRFQMGSPASEKKRGSDEQQHSVQVDNFWMAKTETTFAQWQACVDDGGCQSNKHPKDQGWGRGNRPVINVSWHDANEYARWLSQKTGKKYRLPTEAQWEYAARAGTTTAFSFGNTITTAQANFDGNYTYNGSSKGRYLKQTATVGRYPANGYGLHDLHGNVYEWVCSAYYNEYKGHEKQCANKNDSRSRVLRGGSWLYLPRNVRSAYRFYLTASNRNFNIGFRLSRTH